ncbi:uridine phosphorylase [Actinopolyspora biskrensis]|uniref:Uridine phosphorylase n=1 Tax=Actinopolyspora biskrensis TaxID=1470178 RepID=A0A852ZDU7_9ACTN|nr:purine-nucleoside phosphorylase [Actinopolyspora biskrensis]NYH80163.1 uridine phosphorylase [Actinopolyspora biskrensis]
MPMPISGLPESDTPEAAVVVGSPERARNISALLEDSHLVAQNREFVSFTGAWRGTRVLVSSHGVGGPGAVCLFREIAQAGVGKVIRLGTAGSLTEDLSRGDLFIPECAIRDDGVSDQLVPMSFPATAAPETVFSLQRAAESHSEPADRGIVWTRAAFAPEVLSLPVEEYRGAGAKALEMEVATLLVFAAIRRMRAGALLVIDNDARVDDPDVFSYQPNTREVTDGLAKASRIALDALVHQ